MTKKIRKQELSLETSGSIHKSKKLPEGLVTFSFRHYTASEKFCLPPADRLPTYVPQLLDRLKHVGAMKVTEFRSEKSRSLRAHQHDWHNTSESEGFAHLGEQLRSCEPWQFCLSANEHGRVHGLLIDSVFYVVWIDPNHALYP